MGLSYVDVESLAGEGPGGMVRKTRRATGARAFGFNYFTLPPAVTGRERDRVEADMEDDLEEVYFVVRGGGTMRIDDKKLDVRPGHFFRVDAASTRAPTAGDEGLEFVAFGSPLDGRYEPPDWG